MYIVFENETICYSRETSTKVVFKAFKPYFCYTDNNSIYISTHNDVCYFTNLLLLQPSRRTFMLFENKEQAKEWILNQKLDIIESLKVAQVFLFGVKDKSFQGLLAYSSSPYPGYGKTFEDSIYCYYNGRMSDFFYRYLKSEKLPIIIAEKHSLNEYTKVLKVLNMPDIPNTKSCDAIIASMCRSQS